MFVASTPLAGGISMMGETCVALLGGLQAVRLATGSENIEDEDALVSSMIAGYRFYLKFLTKMESSCCLEIEMARLRYFVDFMDQEKRERVYKAGIDKICGPFVAKSARLAAEFILELREREKAGGKQKRGSHWTSHLCPL